MKKLFFGMTGVLAVLLVFGLIFAGCDTGGGGGGDSGAGNTSTGGSGGSGGGGGAAGGGKLTIENISGHDGEYIFALGQVTPISSYNELWGMGSVANNNSMQVIMYPVKISGGKAELTMYEYNPTYNSGNISSLMFDRYSPYTGNDTVVLSICITAGTTYTYPGMGPTVTTSKSFNFTFSSGGNATVDWNNP
jgi:hypothetical protein